MHEVQGPSECANSQRAASGVEFYGDVDGTFTQFMHKKTDLSKAAMGPGERSNRCAARKCAPCPHADARPQRALRRRAGRSYAAIVEDGVIKALCVEAGPGEVQVGPRPGRAAAAVASAADGRAEGGAPAAEARGAPPRRRSLLARRF